jgi:hypothetical protein
MYTFLQYTKSMKIERYMDKATRPLPTTSWPLLAHAIPVKSEENTLAGGRTHTYDCGAGVLFIIMG